ncbi:tetratricopeptide repeat protein [Deinococcus sp. YIM 134068]|uniref:tetratricopeptide repeat protein n=1 Tax=Deinococcus lichenicola TaxID=3118910 RepID=UPI002F94E12B
MTDVSPPPAGAAAPPDWTAFARAGEWGRALSAARIGTAPAELTEVLGSVSAVQEAVRARRLPQARRAWVGLEEALRELGGGERALLTSLLGPEELGAALGVLEGLGRGTSGESDPEALRERLAPALAHPLTRAEALNALGVLHALREEPEEARARFGEALGADAGHYRALTNLGNLDLEAGHPAEAEARYREALRFNPDFDGAHHNLGVALRRQGRVHEAVGSIRRAQRLSVRRSQEDTRAEMREQFRTSARLRLLRWVLLAVAALVLFLILRGTGG